jgi:hypothetical protein
LLWCSYSSVQRDCSRGRVFLDELDVKPISSSSVIFGHTVSDLQEDVEIEDGLITGTLKYVDEGALPDRWGAGNFLCLDWSDNDFTDFTSVKCGMEPSHGGGLVEIIDDPDKNGAWKVTDKDNQKFVVVISDGTVSSTYKYDLSGLTLETE